MAYDERIRCLREKTGGLAIYVLAEPQAAEFLHANGFGLLSVVPAFRREHPHSAYLFDAKPEEIGAKKNSTLILPNGSLKRVQQYGQNGWEILSDYCSKPQHWAKLDQHVSDLIPAADRSRAIRLASAAAPQDLCAAALPSTPLCMLAQEFCSMDFLESEITQNAAAKKVHRHLAAFFAEALAAVSDAQTDLWFWDERASSPYPESLLPLMKEEHKKVDIPSESLLCLRPVNPEDQVLSGCSAMPALPVCADPTSLSDEPRVMLAPSWEENAPAWKEAIHRHPETVFFLPRPKNDLSALALLVP